jgi:DNA replication protein DnaC
METGEMEEINLEESASSMKNAAVHFLKSRRNSLTLEESKDIMRREYKWPQRYLDGDRNQLCHETGVQIQEYIEEEFFKGPPHTKGIVFVGQLGVGKSTLMGLLGIWIARNYTNRQLYLPADSYVDAIFQDEIMVNAAKTADFLFVDQLAAGYTPDFIATKLNELIEARYANYRTTFVALNMTIGDMKKMPGFLWTADRLNDKTWMLHLTMHGKSLRERS